MKNIDNIIEERLQLYIDKNDELNEVVSLSTALTAGMLVNMFVSIYTSYLTKMARACANYTGSAKTICNLNFKIKGLQSAITKANQVKAKCKDTKNQEKCYEKIDKKITNMQERVKLYVQQLNELKKYNLV